MQTEIFKVKNVKCGGCAANIKKGVSALPGITSVEVKIDGGEVTIAGDSLDRAQLATKLKELGYPEA